MILITKCVYVFFTLTDGPQPYPVRYTAANPVRGLLDRYICTVCTVCTRY